MLFVVFCSGTIPPDETTPAVKTLETTKHHLHQMLPLRLSWNQASQLLHQHLSLPLPFLKKLLLHFVLMLLLLQPPSTITYPLPKDQSPFPTEQPGLSTEPTQLPSLVRQSTNAATD